MSKDAPDFQHDIVFPQFSRKPLSTFCHISGIVLVFSSFPSANSLKGISPVSPPSLRHSQTRPNSPLITSNNCCDAHQGSSLWHSIAMPASFLNPEMIYWHVYTVFIYTCLKYTSSCLWNHFHMFLPPTRLNTTFYLLAYLIQIRNTSFLQGQGQSSSSAFMPTCQQCHPYMRFDFIAISS